MTSEYNSDRIFVDEELMESTEVPEIDDALLMELLEETDISRQLDEVEDADAFGSSALMFQSLEAEIDEFAAGNSLMIVETIHPHEEYCEDCGLDDMISSGDLDGHDCSNSSAFFIGGGDDGDEGDDHFGQCVEMQMAMAIGWPSSGFGDWYANEVDEWEMVHYGDARGAYSCSYDDGDISVEQIYTSLWN